MLLFGSLERQNRCEMSQVTQDKKKWFRRVFTLTNTGCVVQLIVKKSLLRLLRFNTHRRHVLRGFTEFTSRLVDS